MVARPGRILRWFAGRLGPAASFAHISVSASRHSIDESLSFDSVLLSRGAPLGARCVPDRARAQTGAESIPANPSGTPVGAFRCTDCRTSARLVQRISGRSTRKSFTSFSAGRTIFRTCGLSIPAAMPWSDTFVLSVDVKCRSRRDKASRVLRFDFAATTAALSANEYRANSVRGGTSCASFPRRRESNASVVCFGVRRRDTGDSGFRREELRRPRNGGQNQGLSPVCPSWVYGQ